MVVVVDDELFGDIEFVVMLSVVVADLRPLCLLLVVVVELDELGADIVSVGVDPADPGVPVVPIVPASGAGLVPGEGDVIWAVAAVATSIVAANAIMVFITWLLKWGWISEVSDWWSVLSG